MSAGSQYTKVHLDGLKVVGAYLKQLKIRVHQTFAGNNMWLQQPGPLCSKIKLSVLELKTKISPLLVWLLILLTFALLLEMLASLGSEDILQGRFPRNKQNILGIRNDHPNSSFLNSEITNFHKEFASPEILPGEKKYGS